MPLPLPGLSDGGHHGGGDGHLQAPEAEINSGSPWATPVRLGKRLGDQPAEEGVLMADGRVLVVGGTHGNERNAAWLLEHWRQETSSLQSHGLDVDLVIGNPAALAAGVRYLDRDLNRSFQPALLEDPEQQELEIQRARQLLAAHGPSGVRACPVVLDLHSTTAAMGNSLVLYGRRPADLALAAGIQGLLGLPIYLHEDDDSQHGFLIERWPCGLVIEVGPVPQG